MLRIGTHARRTKKSEVVNIYHGGVREGLDFCQSESLLQVV